MYSIHENRHFMYDSCTIHRVVSIVLRRGCLFYFLLSCIDHRLLTFIFIFHFFNLYLYIHIPIYISRHLLTTKMHIHTHIHMFYIFYFPHQTPQHCQQITNAKAKKGRAIYFSYAKPGTSGSQDRLIFFLNSSYTISS